jgi:hypothetical protein
MTATCWPTVSSERVSSVSKKGAPARYAGEYVMLASSTGSSVAASRIGETRTTAEASTRTVTAVASQGTRESNLRMLVSL